MTGTWLVKLSGLSLASFLGLFLFLVFCSFNEFHAVFPLDFKVVFSNAVKLLLVLN